VITVYTDADVLLKNKNMFTESKKYFTFAPTVSVQHAVKFARASFFLKNTTIIHLPCLSAMHTWGVFSFNNNLKNVLS